MASSTSNASGIQDDAQRIQALKDTLVASTSGIDRGLVRSVGSMERNMRLFNL